MSALPMKRPDAHIQMFSTYSAGGRETRLHLRKKMLDGATLDLHRRAGKGIPIPAR